MDAYVRTIIFTVIVPGSVTVYVPYFLLTVFRSSFLFEIGPLWLLGIPLLALGASIYAWCAWDFASQGRGSPAMYVDEPRRLVAIGLYRKVRNPMYIGVTIILVGEVLLLRSSAILIYLLFVALAFHLQVAYHEEPRLMRKFGKEYEEYRKAVPRLATIPLSQKDRIRENQRSGDERGEGRNHTSILAPYTPGCDEVSS